MKKTPDADVQRLLTKWLFATQHLETRLPEPSPETEELRTECLLPLSTRTWALVAKQWHAAFTLWKAAELQRASDAMWARAVPLVVCMCADMRTQIAHLRFELSVQRQVVLTGVFLRTGERQQYRLKAGVFCSPLTGSAREWLREYQAEMHEALGAWLRAETARLREHLAERRRAETARIAETPALFLG
jgi:hypothetical protein